MYLKQLQIVNNSIASTIYLSLKSLRRSAAVVSVKNSGFWKKQTNKELVLENKVFFYVNCLGGVMDPCRVSTFPVAFILTQNQQETISNSQSWYDFTYMKKCHGTYPLELLEYLVF